MEIDAIGEILNISLGSSATSVSELLGQPVNITTPEVKLMKTSEFDIRTYEPAIGVEINYIQGLSGKNILILKESDVKVIIGLLLQTDFSEQEFVMDEMNIGAICEVMNQMMGASSTALSQFLNRSINISPPSSFAIGSTEQFKKKYFEGAADIVAVYFNLMIGNLVNSQFINVMPVPLAKDLVSKFGLNLSQDPNNGVLPQTVPVPDAQVSQPRPAAPAARAKSPAAGAQARPAAAPAGEQVPPPVGAGPAAGAQARPAAAPAQEQVPPPVGAVPAAGAQARPAAGTAGEQVPPPSRAVPAVGTEIPVPQTVSPTGSISLSGAVYPSFDEPSRPLTRGETSNLNMILSVPLQVTVEIGRTSKKIKEILDFSVGTIVELNKQAGSQVDIYVNGQAIAKGNVVVVDDFYGVRITEVVNSDEIMKLV